MKTTTEEKPAMLPAAAANTAPWPQYEAAIAAYAPYEKADKDILLWLTAYAQESTLSLGQLSDRIGLSATVLQRLCTGKYGADHRQALTKIRRYKDLTEKRAQASTEQELFVETAFTRRIYAALEYAIIRNQIVSLIGHTQRGKTTAIKAYARQNGADCIIIRCPVSPSPWRLAKKIAQALGSAGTSSNLDTSTSYITKRISSQTLLVIDEIHQVLLQPRATGVRTIEFLRELADETSCGLVLVGTNVWGDLLTQDPNWKGVLEQTVKRGITVRLANELPVDDLRAFWQHYGLPEPGSQDLAYISNIANNEGLGLYTKLLASGLNTARNRNQPYTWAHFRAAKQTIDNLASGK